MSTASVRVPATGPELWIRRGEYSAAGGYFSVLEGVYGVYLAPGHGAIEFA